ncbi:MAG: signal peptide peptidase SppA, partial [Bryobacteraceae bacterium]
GGLIDGLLYEDQVFGALKNRLNLPIKTITEQDYARAQVAGTEGPSRIAFVVAECDITQGGTNDGITDTGITATAMVKLLRQVGNDSSIKGVIFRIDSPGGDGIASDDILHAAKELSAKKPMIVSMSDVAASGGYFIAMTGDNIVAYQNTETGSIGVFYGKADVQDLLKKAGITETTLKRGQFSDIESMTRPLTDAERAKLHDEIEVFYRQFVERVAAGRKRPYDQIEPLAQGRVWTGAQARQNGLIDDVGGLDRAIEMIKAKAGIPASQKVTLVMFPPRRSLWDLLFNRGDDSAEVDAMIQKKVEAVVGHIPIGTLMRGGFLKLMPYTIEVR